MDLKRTQGSFDKNMFYKLNRKAKIMKNTVSEIFKKEKSKNWEDDSLWNIVGASSSKDKDLSVNHDKYLY